MWIIFLNLAKTFGEMFLFSTWNIKEGQEQPHGNPSWHYETQGSLLKSTNFNSRFHGANVDRQKTYGRFEEVMWKMQIWLEVGVGLGLGLGLGLSQMKSIRTEKNKTRSSHPTRSSRKTMQVWIGLKKIFPCAPLSQVYPKKPRQVQFSPLGRPTPCFLGTRLV